MTEHQVSREERSVPSSQPILVRVVKFSLIAALVQTLVLSTIGWLVADSEGLFGALIGSALSAVFLLLTALSIIFANKLVSHDLFVVWFFLIVMGTWLLKFVAFIIAALLLRDQPWLNPVVLFVSIIVGVVISLTVDVFVVAKSRLPYVSDAKI